jgi:hypothetical protein
VLRFEITPSTSDGGIRPRRRIEQRAIAEDPDRREWPAQAVVPVRFHP